MCWGGYFQGEGQEKILQCKGLDHYMKNKNTGGVLSTQPDQQKGPNAKMHKKCNKKKKKKKKKLSNIENFSSLVSLIRYFTKFIFLEQLTGMPQFNIQEHCFFLFSKQSS